MKCFAWCRAERCGQKTVRQDKCPQKEISSSETQIFFMRSAHKSKNKHNFTYFLHHFNIIRDFLNITMQTPQRVVDPRGHSILSLSNSRNESLLRNDPHEVSQ